MNYTHHLYSILYGISFIGIYNVLYLFWLELQLRYMHSKQIDSWRKSSR